MFQTKVTKQEYRRLMDEYTHTWQLREVRAAGKVVADDVSLSELERLWRIVRLQRKGARIPDSASIAEIEDFEVKQDELRYYHAKVVGVSFTNPDGKSRQRIIAGCYPCELLQLRPEPENPVDKNAVVVLRASGEQIGYLQADQAEEVSRRLSCGWHYVPIIKEILGEDCDAPGRGVLLLIAVAKPHVSLDRLKKYVEELRQMIYRGLS